jgi:1,4-alpha-glucan branching enzyme
LASQSAFAIVVYWDPPAPAPGETVTIFYNVIEGTLPDDTDPVYIHLGVNGWQNTDNYPMIPDSVAGWWKYSYDIPLYVEVIDFVFTDLQGNWDNNGGIGIDWHISLNYSWDPFYPTPNDSVKLIVRNSDQGGTIAWYVISNETTLPPHPSYWPPGSTLTPDGEALESPVLGPNDDGDYFLYLGPFNSAAQLVDFVKFKIHWADGTWDPSLFEIAFDYTPQPGDPEVSILAPSADEEIQGPTLISVQANEAIGVEIWGGIDSLGVYTEEPYEAIWIPSVNNFGRVYVVAKAFNDSGRVSFARVGVNVAPSIVTLDAPEGVEDGVTVSGNTVTFALYAPAKQYVALKGSFNQELPNGELMYVSGDSLWWTSKRLSDGEYWYQYNLEGIKLVADPWSWDVRWKQPGTDIESGSYHHAKTQFAVGTQPFVWTDENFVRPPVDELIVYELHVSDFAARPDGSIGTYQDVVVKLEEGYFDSLGINAVELMPINEFEGENSWGYNPSYYMAPETAYGTPNSLRNLVNRFHEHGIAVLLDVVFNHMWGSAPLFQLYQPLDDWDYRNHDYDHCPYFHNAPSDWGYKLQHWREVNGRRYRTWKYVTDALHTWVVDYHIDGFRYDAAWGVGWDGYDGNGMSFYTWYVNELDPGLIQIIEEDNAYRVNTTETDAAWNFSYFHAMKANLQEITDGGHTWGDMNDLANEMSYGAQGFNDFYGPLNYVESHDESRIIYEATVYQGMDHATALKKSRLGATVLLTGTGTPMLYAGQEFGQNGTSRDEYGGVIPQPLQWDNLNDYPCYSLWQDYRRLIWLRNNYGILKSGSFSIRLQNSNTKSIVFWRGDSGTDEQLVIVANFDDTEHTPAIEFPTSGTWYEFTQDDSVDVVNGWLGYYLMPAATARVFVNKHNWPLPAGEAPSNGLPLTLELAQNHPNPFSGHTHITFGLPDGLAGDTDLAIFDLTGRKVRTLATDKQSPGRYQIEWDGTDDRGRSLPAGVLLVRLDAGNGTSLLRRMIKIR